MRIGMHPLPHWRPHFARRLHACVARAVRGRGTGLHGAARLDRRHFRVHLLRRLADQREALLAQARAAHGGAHFVGGGRARPRLDVPHAAVSEPPANGLGRRGERRELGGEAPHQVREKEKEN